MRGLQPPIAGTQNNEASAPAPSIPATTGAPSSTDGLTVGQGGVSDEVRPPSLESPKPPGAPFIPEPHPGMSGITNSDPPPAPESPSKHQRDLFAADVLRYYLLREIPFGQDGSFSFEALITRYNADLANGYGNLVSRTLNMIHQYFEGLIPDEPGLSLRKVNMEDSLTFSLGLAPDGTEIANQSDYEGALKWDRGELVGALPASDVFQWAMNSKNFSAALEAAWNLIGRADGYITSHAPWKLAKDPSQKDLLEAVLYNAAESIRIITSLLYPILPYATSSVWRQLGLGDIEECVLSGQVKDTWRSLKPGTRLGPLAPIFPRADKGLAQIMADMETQKDLKLITDNADAATPSATEFKEAPIASLTGQRFEAPAEAHHAPTDPAAGPRTASFSEPNPGSQVAGSTAHTTERPGTPSHSDVNPSGIFAKPHEDPARAASTITIDDFAKVELRVAQILVCERIPKADKLLRLEVDLGYEKTPDPLRHRRVVHPRRPRRPPHRRHHQPRAPQDARPRIPRHAPRRLSGALSSRRKARQTTPGNLHRLRLTPPGLPPQVALQSAGDS